MGGTANYLWTISTGRLESGALCKWRRYDNVYVGSERLLKDSVVLTPPSRGIPSKESRKRRILQIVKCTIHTVFASTPTYVLIAPAGYSIGNSLFVLSPPPPGVHFTSPWWRDSNLADAKAKTEIFGTDIFNVL